MKTNTPYVWTGDDYEHGACRADQVGTPKPVEQSASRDEQSATDLVAELPKATMAELKQAALRVARGKMGYDEFLLKNPGFHQKFLLSMVKEPLPPGPARVDVNISWLSADRLAYKQVEPVPEVSDVEHRPMREALSATPSDAGESAPLLELATTLEPGKAVEAPISDQSSPSSKEVSRHWKEASELERAINARNKLDEI